MLRDKTAPISLTRVSSTPISFVLLAIVSASSVVGSRHAWGESPQFTVTTTIRGEQNGPPLAIHRTLFRDGMVYDLTEVPADQRRFVTIFDFPGEQVVLLDQENRVRTSLPIATLAEATARARVAAEQSPGERSLGLDAEVAVGGNPVRYSVAFDRLRYDTSAQTPEDPAIAESFARFTDWAARLNVVQKVTAPPPFARMKLNQRIAADNRLPKQLVFTVDRADASTRWYVDHALTESLSEVEAARIDAIRLKAEGYSPVGWDSFPR